MDGYIKNKEIVIMSARKTILWKYALSLIIAVLIPVWIFALAVSQPPEKWTHTDITFSHISREPVGLRRGLSDIIYTADGRGFVINALYVNADALRSGNKYSIVYSETLAGGDHVRALSDTDAVYMDLGESVSRWEDERWTLIMLLLVNVVAVAAAIALIDRLWCRKEHAQIAKHKADIARRMRKYETGETT